MIYIKNIEGVEITYLKENEDFKLYCKKGDTYKVWKFPFDCCLFPPYYKNKTATEDLYIRFNRNIITEESLYGERKFSTRQLFTKNDKVYNKAKVVVYLSCGHTDIHYFETNEGAIEFANIFINKCNLWHYNY